MRTHYITDQEIIKKTILDCDVCFVGMTDKNNQPYVIPMNFGYVDGCFYLHSAPEGHHISCLEKNNKVCITLCSDRQLAWQNQEIACSYTMKSKSIVALCEISFIEEYNKKIEILNTLMSHYSGEAFNYSTPSVNNVKIWQADIQQITCKEFGVPYRK